MFGSMVFLLPSAGAQVVTIPPGFQSETLYSGFGAYTPTNFKIAPDGRTFVALKSGIIDVLPAGSPPNTTPETFVDIRKQVNDYGDRGLLGLALDPKFDEGRPYVYALYTYDHELGAPGGAPKWGQASKSYEGDECPESAEHGCPVSGRLVRFTAEENHAIGHAKPSATAPEEKVLVEGWCQQFPSHSIGDLEFGPEGALFATGGEGANYTAADYGQYGNLCGDPSGEGGSLRAQSPLRPGGQVLLNGTLIRINPDTGKGWPGNPYAASSNENAKRIIGFGFRNPFRFTIDTRSDEVFVDNVGFDKEEEIDRFPIESGQAYNSGWPCYEGLEPTRLFQPLGLPACKRLYENPGSTSAPFFRYSHTSGVAPGDTCPSSAGSAISGAAFYEGSSYPTKYDDALFFSDSVRSCLYVMYADADGDPDPSRVELFLSEPSSYTGVDMEQGPNGEILFDSLVAGTISRIGYDPGAPQAHLTANKEWGSLPLNVEFNAGASTGQAGHTLSYKWDFNEDGVFNEGTGPTQTRQYTSATNATVAVQVEDQTSHKTSVAKLTVYPGDSPPAVTIPSPVPTLTWGVGQPISFAGSATENGGAGAAVETQNLYWKIRLLHCPFGPTECHEHPLQVFPGVSSGQVAAPDHDYPSYLNFTLTATDKRGLSNERTVKIAARPDPLQLRSVPPGIELVAGTKAALTPFELVAIEDSPTTLIAPETQVVEGDKYTFREWSDGGARVHSVGVIGPATYTAYYSASTGPLPTVPITAAPIAAAPVSPAPLVPKALKLFRHPGKTAHRRVARFAFDGAAGVTFRCRLDGDSFSACHSPSVYRNLSPGTHVFRVQEIGADGEPIAPIRRFTWFIAGSSAQRAH
jgi:glucose/arabinose dehydrogenase